MLLLHACKDPQKQRKADSSLSCILQGVHVYYPVKAAHSFAVDITQTHQKMPFKCTSVCKCANNNKNQMLIYNPANTLNKRPCILPFLENESY